MTVYLRELQVAAPRMSRELNVKLSVLSEVAYHVIKRTQPEASFVKLVVAIRSEPFPGDPFVMWPGGIAEFRLSDQQITAEIDESALRRRIAIHIDEAIERAEGYFVGSSASLLRSRLSVELKNPPPYEFELEHLAKRDPVSKRTLRVFHQFDAERSEVLLRSDDGSFKEQTVASAPFFIDLGGLFHATRSKIVGDRVLFLRGPELVAAAVVR
jgi:hypothetical protein